MNWFEKIVNFLLFKIERPTSYGLFHILWIILSICALVFLIKHKEKNHEKYLKKILLVYGIGALILEIIKQIIWSFNYENGVVTWDYEWYSFPFQLCTTPIIVSIICACLKKGRFRDYLFSYLSFITILGSIATAIYPEDCFVRTLLVDIHTMYLHFGSLVVSLYLIITKEVKPNFKNFLNGYLVFLVFVIIAQVLNISIYNSGILNGETFNMFYISPYFISALPIMNLVQQNVPYLLYLIIYLSLIFTGGIIILLISKFLKRG